MPDEHDFFLEHIEDALTGALSDPDRARFEQHRSECESCRAEFAAMQKLENHMSALFAAVRPGSNFENNLITRFRDGAPRLRINPMIFRAAGATAAAVLLATLGHVVSNRMSSGTLPLWGDPRPPAVAMRGQALGRGDQADELQGRKLAGHGEWRFGGGAVTRGDSDDTIAGRPVSQERYGLGMDNKDKAPAPEEQANLRVPALRGAVGGAIVDAVARRRLSETDEQKSNDWYKTALYRERGDFDRSAAPDGAKRLDDQSAVRAAEAPAPKDALYFQPNANPEQLRVLALKATDVEKSAGTQRAAIAGVRIQPTTPSEPSGTGGIVDAVVLGESLGKPMAPAEGRKEEATENQPAQAGQGTDPAPPQLTPEQQSALIQRKVIRNGEIEFEVDSYDSAFMTVSKIVAEEGGLVATTNSEKLPNGKVKGTITVRVAPDRLDSLVMKLRALGDLKRQNLTAQDITKEYYDISSELRAAKAMQDRLIEIIKTGNGQIKDLLSVEKELAVWRGKLEKLEGSIRYYDNLVALSTLNISVYERELKAAAVTKQTEVADLGVECENVEQARADAIKAIEESKGRVIESELKKFEAGQFGAKIVADVSPDEAGAVLDRMKQLGKVARLEVQRKQVTADGQPPLPGAKIEKGETRIVASFYNLANVQPRQTVNLSLACEDVEATYAKVLARVERAGGRIVSSNLNREKPNQTTGAIQFEVKAGDAEPVLLDVRSGNETMRLVVTENPDAANVTTAKRGFAVSLASTMTVPPRETASINAAATDVPGAHKALLDAAAAARARVLSADLNETDRQNVSGSVDMEIRRDKLDEINKVLTGPATIVARTVQRSSDIENTLDSKVRLQLRVIAADQLPARQLASLGIEVARVDDAVEQLIRSATDSGGKVLDSTRSSDTSGQTVARVVVEVPLAKFDGALAGAKNLGKVRAEQQSKNTQVPEINLSRGRLEVTFANADSIVTADSGVWSSIRKGLATSFGGLMWSLQLIIIGVCLVAPWVLMLWGGWKLWKRSKRKPVTLGA